MKTDPEIKSNESNSDPRPTPGNEGKVKLHGVVAHSKQRLIGDKQRLSESVLWEIQRNFYARHSHGAWRAGTLPLEITSNPRIANAYARVIYGFWKDAGFRRPVRIVELGSGHGRFGYLFLHAFDALNRRLSPGAKFRYVMTDMSEHNLELLKSHPRLQRFVEAGVLEFVRLDMESDGTADAILADNPENPMAVIANYAFDSIPADAFYVEEKQVFETLVTVQAPPQTWPDWDDPYLFSKLCISCTHHPAQTGCYSEPLWNDILEHYRQSLSGSSFLFPVATLRCIEGLRQVASQEFLLLVADKGKVHEDELDAEELIPGMVVHAEGCISLSVDFGIISRYFCSQGGVALRTSHHATNLNVAAFLMGQANRQYIETAQAFEDGISRNGPDDWFTIGSVIESLGAELTLDQVLAYLRLSAWSPSCFLHLFSTIVGSLPQATAQNKQDLYQAAFEIQDVYYFIGEKADLAFHLGVLLLEMEFYKEAMQFFRDSVAMHGPQAATSYNLGLCFFGMGQMHEALALMDESLSLDSEYKLAKAMRASLMPAQGNGGEKA